MNLGTRPRLYFHTFWTRPQFVDSGRVATELLELPDFEALTWLTSALEARRHGSIRLFTDLRGRQFIRNVGLEWVYNGGITLELEAIPNTINPAVFWSAGKLFAWRSIGEGAVSLDPDAVCWSPVEASAPVVVLHCEELDSGDYCFHRERYGRFGFEGPEWDWTAEPINAGVLFIADPSFARRYADEAIRFMTDFSAALAAEPLRPDTGESPWGDAMLFAEQRLVSMLLRRHGLRGAALTTYDTRRQHLSLNSQCLHLWGTKRFYPRCREARIAYVNYLIGHLRRAFPESVETLRHWKLDEPLALESVRPDPAPQFPLVDAGGGYCRLGRIDGMVEIQDANLEVRRPGYPGALVGLAEILHPAPGTSFELTEVRRVASGLFPSPRTIDAPQDRTGNSPKPVSDLHVAPGSGNSPPPSGPLAGE